MITEAQFTTAMERAVEKRGADWKYPAPEYAPHGFYVSNHCPTYSDGHGNPTCLVGAALYELGMPLPQEGSPSAVSLLLNQYPLEVALAARCAQMHQDRRNTWGESLEVYKTALELMHRNPGSYHPVHGEMIYAEVRRKMQTGKWTKDIDKATSAMKDLLQAFSNVGASANMITFDGFAAGGVISMTSAIDETSVFPGVTSMSKGTITITGMSLTAPMFTEAIQPVLYKKEHALTA